MLVFERLIVCINFCFFVHYPPLPDVCMGAPVIEPSFPLRYFLDSTVSPPYDIRFVED
jgi:hypothetical protein